MSLFSRPTVPTVSVQEARAAIDAGALLLDVREDDEWAAGHAPEAVHVSMGRLHPDHPQLQGVGKVVVICRSGNRSGRVTEALRGIGIEAFNMAGGMQAWQAAGEPVVRTDGRPGAVI